MNATLFAQIVVFFILVWFSMKFVWPPIMKALDERAAKIAEGLAAAESGRQSLEQADKKSADTVREGRTKASDIVAQAERRAQQIIADAKLEAQKEADQVRAMAKMEIEQSTQNAREALRQRVAELAIAGAEKILRREVDAKTHGEMLSRLQQEL